MGRRLPWIALLPHGFHEPVLPVALEHQVGGTPDIDPGYHAGKLQVGGPLNATPRDTTYGHSSTLRLDFRLQEARIGGVSTRRVDDLVQAMGLSGISKSQVSKLGVDRGENFDAGS